MIKKLLTKTFATKQLGVSLVELMVAIALGLFLVAGLGQLFVKNKQTFTATDGIARMQENARYALYILNTDLRMAGYEGCRTMLRLTPTILVTAPPASMLLNPTNMIGGYLGTTGGWNPALPTWLTNNGTIAFAPQTDVIFSRKASATAANVTTNMTTSSDNITVTNTVNFQPNDLLFISDCQSADVFQATNGTTATNITHSTTSNTTSNFSKLYLTDAQVSRYELNAYYIKNTGRVNSKGLPILALFRQSSNGAEEELVEGVENMKVTYGIDTNADGAADQFLTADAVNLNNYWGQVVSLKVNILVNTIEQVAQTPQPYVFNGATITPTDRLIHKEWSTYINLRDNVS